MGKCNHGVDWLQKGLWHNSAKLDHRLFQNARDICQREKNHPGSNEKLESEIDKRRKDFYCGDNPGKYLPGKSTFTITFFNTDDAIESQEKINHLIYVEDIKLFVKNYKELETLIQTIRIYCQDIAQSAGAVEYTDCFSAEG